MSAMCTFNATMQTFDSTKYKEQKMHKIQWQHSITGPWSLIIALANILRKYGKQPVYSTYSKNTQ